MLGGWQAFTLFSLVATLVSSIVQAEKTSPCPELFEYEGTEHDHQWVGTLKIPDDDELHGLWIRVKFDAPVKDIVLPNDWEAVPRSSSNNEYLLKNSKYILKVKSKNELKITVKYEGDKVPNLIGYRLNAKTVCPEQSGNPADIFKNDYNTEDFLSQILDKEDHRPGGSQSNYECGKTSPQAKQPWLSAIFVSEGDKSRYLCEATLITPQHVVTAAHCVTYKNTEDRLVPQTLKVHFGKTHLHEAESKQKLAVENIKLYPGYQFDKLFNDLAVLKLNSSVVFDDFVRPICLPEVDRVADNKNIVSGYTSQTPNGNLEEAQVKRIPISQCEQLVGNLKPLLHDSTYCAVYENDERQCVGDSGSPVTSLATNTWELRGIVTYGAALQKKNVCNKNTAILLTDVTHFARWIRAATS